MTDTANTFDAALHPRGGNPNNPGQFTETNTNVPEVTITDTFGASQLDDDHGRAIRLGVNTGEANTPLANEVFPGADEVALARDELTRIVVRAEFPHFDTVAIACAIRGLKPTDIEHRDRAEEWLNNNEAAVAEFWKAKGVTMHGDSWEGEHLRFETPLGETGSDPVTFRAAAEVLEKSDGALYIREALNDPATLVTDLKAAVAAYAADEGYDNGICRADDCDESTDDGEGSDGYCGNCADKDSCRVCVDSLDGRGIEEGVLLCDDCAAEMAGE